MARIARMIIRDESAVYHVISRTTLEGFVLGDVEKEFLLKYLKRLSALYFTEVLGFCLMGNHFHLLVRMHPGTGYTDEEIGQRYGAFYGRDKARLLADADIPKLRSKLADLSSFIKDLKQGFTRYYNKLHNKRGYFWADRFKSLIVDNGDTLINCLAYIDLNPVRAGLVKRPEDYRWNSIGYHVQGGNKGGFLSTDFGLVYLKDKKPLQRLRYYREFLYEKGAIQDEKAAVITREMIEQERERGFEIGRLDCFRYRMRYFTDGGVIGSREFVAGVYARFKGHFNSRREKQPKRVKGLEGIYALKRLSEGI